MFYTLWPKGGTIQLVLYTQGIVAMMKWNFHVDRLKHCKNTFSLIESVGEFNPLTKLKMAGPVESGNTQQYVDIL